MSEVNSISNYLEIKNQAKGLLIPFLGNEQERLSELAQMYLRPKLEDYARVFVPEVVENDTKGYEPFWAESPFPKADSNQTEVLVHFAHAEKLKYSEEFFPGGYQNIIPYLLPDRIWLSWKYVTPGEITGTAYDGLVWLDNRFAWFPKPWKVLPEN